MSKGKQSEKLKGNKNAKKGEHESIVVRIPVHLVDALHKCLILEGEFDPDNSRISEYALGILDRYVRKKIEYDEAIML